MLTSMLAALPKRKVDWNIGRYRKLYQTVCVAYIHCHLGLVPARPPKWSRRPRGCHLSAGTNCDDCAVLDRFLLDPEHTVIRFAMDSQRRRHIEDQLKDQPEKLFLQLKITMTDPSKPIVKTRGNLSQYMLVITKTDEEWQQDLAQ